MKIISRYVQKITSSSSAPGYTLLTIALFLNIVVQGSAFFSRWNFSTIANSATPLVLVSIGQMIIILSGNVDLSLGTMMTVVNALAITLPELLGIPIWLAWILIVIASTMMGFFNGIIVSKVRLPAFLATFATGSMFQGLALIILPSPGGRVPREIYSVYNGFFLGIPTPMFIIIGSILIWIFISKAKLGVSIRAVGGEPRNSFITTVYPGRIGVVAFMLGGFFAGLGGLSLTLHMATGDPWFGAPFTLRAIAVVVLGGCLFNTGKGGIGGTVSGAFFFIIVSNIVFFGFSALDAMVPWLRISTFYQDLATNVIVVFGLVSSVVFKRQNQKDIITPQKIKVKSYE